MSLLSKKSALAAVALIGFVGSVQAAEILQFTSESLSAADIHFGGSPIPSLSTGSGATFDLQLSTAFTAPVTAALALAGQDPLDPSTFDGATLNLSGFQASAAATSSGSSVTQLLGSGDFTITGLDGSVLLSGHAANATLSGTGDTGGTISATVTYNNSGDLLRPYYVGNTGSFSFALALISSNFSITGGYVAPFDANVSGDFQVNSVPVPAAALGGTGLMGLVGLTQFRRRRSAAL